jgi:GT2 family glycosyltransferase
VNLFLLSPSTTCQWLERVLPAMSNREVAVVLACHNSDQWESILSATRSAAQQVDISAQVVLAVDHNPDLSARLRSHFHDLTVVDNDSGIRGASATRNAGAEAARTDLIAFLDDDERAEPDWLVKLIEPFWNPHVVGTGGRYIPDWQIGRPSWFPNEFAWVVGAHHSGMPDVESPVRNVWSGNMAVRAEIFRAVHGFRTDFGKVGTRSRPEDTDLCMRMASASQGGLWMYLPDAQIYHAVPAGRSTFSFFLGRCYAEGRGKIDLAKSVGESSALDVERDYMKRTVPLGIWNHWTDAFSAMGKSAAMIAGVGAAGIGALASTAEHKMRARRRAS